MIIKLFLLTLKIGGKIEDFYEIFNDVVKQEHRNKLPILKMNFLSLYLMCYLWRFTH